MSRYQLASGKLLNSQESSAEGSFWASRGGANGAVSGPWKGRPVRPRCHQLVEFFPSSGKLSSASLPASKDSFAESVRGRRGQLSPCMDGRVVDGLSVGSPMDDFPPLATKLPTAKSVSARKEKHLTAFNALGNLTLASGTLSKAKQGNCIAPVSAMSSVKGNSLFSGTEAAVLLEKNSESVEFDKRTTLTDTTRRGDMEDFLFSMLGDGCKIGIDTVRDVLDYFEGDMQKSIDRLLRMAATSSALKYSEKRLMETSLVMKGSNSTQLHDDSQSGINPDPLHTLLESSDIGMEQATQVLLGEQNMNASTTLHGLAICQDLKEHLSGQENSSRQLAIDYLHKAFPSIEMSALVEVLQASSWSYSDALKMLLEAGVKPMTSHAIEASGCAMVSKFVGQLLLEPKVEDKCIDDSHILKPPEYSQDLQKLGSKALTDTVGHMPSAVLQPVSDVECDDYERHTQSAKELWQTMKYYFKEATVAYTRGEHERVALLLEKGMSFKELAHEASKRASGSLLYVKNRDVENNITLDLHTQNTRDALRLLKLHLKSLAPIPSFQYLTIITDSDSQCVGGCAKIKIAVVQYLDRKGIDWTEINPVNIVIRMKDVNTRNPTGCYFDHGQNLPTL